MNEGELKKVFKAKKKRSGKDNKVTEGFERIQFDDFLNWFNEDLFNKGCHYCGLTNEQSNRLYQLRPKATRGGKRGKRLELDRLTSHLPYDQLSNIVWCCYWCNNAKSNFFSENEFRPVGLAIGSALKEILNNG